MASTTTPATENLTAQCTNFGKSKKYGSGDNPDISITDNFFVEIHQGSDVPTLSYHVGLIQGADLTLWGGTLTFDSNGSQPSVAVNRDRYVVETHQDDRGKSQLYYRLGRVDLNKLEIIWVTKDRASLTEGSYSNLAMNNAGYLVAVHQGDRGKIYSIVGQLDTGSSSPTIKWQPRTFYPDLGRRPAISINDMNKAVLVYSRDDVLYYSVATIDPKTPSISWGNEIEYDKGQYPDVSLGNDGQVITTHQSQRWNSKLFTKCGRIEGLRIPGLDRSARHFDNGGNPCRVSANSRLAMQVHPNEGHLSLFESTSSVSG